MLNGQGLRTFLTPSPAPDLPAFIIYSPVFSKRLEYVCSFIFSQVLNVRWMLTNDAAAFESSDSVKINYSQREISNCVQIIPHSLLFETGISETRPRAVVKNEMLYFFTNEPAGDREALHFDLFSAVFYFISRYEEWQPFEKDTHGRFETKASILFQNGFHLRPVVDHWILELKTFLQQHHHIRFPPKKFKIVSSIDVDNLFAYRHKGFFRTLGASLKDILKGDLRNLALRMRVLGGRARDPFDIYEEISEFCLAQEIPLIYFFLFRTGTRYDRTVDPLSEAFKQVITSLKNKQTEIGLHPSYDSAFRPDLLEQEIKSFSSLLGQRINLSRQHFLRFDIRTTPALLLKNGITADYSMGFASSTGFRAGTSHPFFYYDLSAEKKSDLLFVPFCAMDGAYFVYNQISPDEALTSLMELCAEVKRSEGIFMTIFHERTFSDHLYPGFGTLYKNLHLRAKTL